ncbi:MAG: pilus assembly protein CpaC [Bermanella sp.]|jgi:pilus assembly protein CpaC
MMNIKVLKTAGLLLWVLIPDVLAARSLPSMLTLYEGESKVLTANNVERIAVGKAEMVGSTILESGEIVLTADAVGETNMQVWFKSGSREQVSLVIVESNGYRELTEVQQLLSGVAGIEIRAVGRRVVVDGNLHERDLERVSMVQKRYANMLVLAQPISEFAQKMIYFDVKIMEFNKDDVEELGINWSTSIEGPNLRHARTVNQNNFFRGSNTQGTDPLAALVGVPATGLGGQQSKSLTYWGLVSEITSRINFLERNGSALTLASPRLSTRSGGKAKLTVGGQVPVVSSSSNGTTVEYKDFGIMLEISPALDPYGNLLASVSTEVSQLDKANQVQDFPAFRTRHTDNDVAMKPGETLVLAGLITREEQSSYEGIKWLKDIPILGKLFESKSYKGGKTELVVFITPTVMEDLASGVNRKELDRGRQLMGEFADSLSDGLLE